MKKAFTLAEVLITLGIIGVVAALTLPVLIQNHRKHVVETRLEKFYSTINQAITMAEAEYGERESWYNNNSTLTDYEWFNKYLTKYVKALKIVEDSNHNAVVYFPDGSLVVFAKAGIMFYPVAKDLEYCQSLDDAKECSGIKYFAFFYNPTIVNQDSYTKYTNTLVEPYKHAWDGNDSTLLGETPLDNGSYKYACKKGVQGGYRVYCTALIQRNGWKIPKDYPFRF